MNKNEQRRSIQLECYPLYQMMKQTYEWFTLIAVKSDSKTTFWEIILYSDTKSTSPASSSGAKREWAGDETQLVTGRSKKRGEARFLLLAFLCSKIFIERETSGYEASTPYLWTQTFVRKQIINTCSSTSVGKISWFVSCKCRSGFFVVIQ